MAKKTIVILLASVFIFLTEIALAGQSIDQDQPLMLKGTVMLHVNAAGDLLIFIQEMGIDGKLLASIQHVFVFQTTVKISESLNGLVIENAFVSWRPRGISITSSENQKLVFLLEDIQINDLKLLLSQNDGINKYGSVNIVWGFGLAKRFAAWELYPHGKTGQGACIIFNNGFSTNYPDSTLSNLQANEIDRPPFCDSGGEGSLSCSISNQYGGCSVSCSEGYYACCISRVYMEPICFCEKE